MRGRSRWPSVLVAGALIGLAACGGGGESGSRTLNWYVFDEPGGSFTEAAANCSTDSYRVEVQVLPSDADQQREQLVRRLAANDSSIDLIGMDVIWTAEFAEAGWIVPFEGDTADEAADGKLEAAVQSATYDGTLYGVPFTSNTQLLWYRTDLVDEPPATWDEMIDMAEALADEGEPHLIQAQGQRYEGLTVFFTTMQASAGGRILGDDGDEVALDEEPTKAALETLARYADSVAAPDTLSTALEDDGRLGFEAGDSAFMVNYPFVYPSAESNAPDIFENLGWAPFPSVVEGEPARVVIGGVNVGVSADSRNPDEAAEAAVCLASEENQIFAATNGGLPPTIEALYDDDRVRETYPFADVLRESLDNAVQRAQTPLYNDVSLAISGSIHPLSEIDVDDTYEELVDTVQRALDGEGLL